MKITAEDLHRAADVFGETADETALERYGLLPGALEEFIHASDWSEGARGGPAVDLDPLSLATGVCIGLIAAAGSQMIAK